MFNSMRRVNTALPYLLLHYLFTIFTMLSAVSISFSGETDKIRLCTVGLFIVYVPVRLQCTTSVPCRSLTPNVLQLSKPYDGDADVQIAETTSCRRCGANRLPTETNELRAASRPEVVPHDSIPRFTNRDVGSSAGVTAQDAVTGETFAIPTSVVGGTAVAERMKAESPRTEYCWVPSDPPR